MIVSIMWYVSGVRRGLGGFNTPRTGKKYCRKRMIFPNALFLATNFPKIDKNSLFPLHFHQNFSTFSQNFPNQLWVSSKRAKIKRRLLKFFAIFGKFVAKNRAFGNNIIFLQQNFPISGGDVRRVPLGYPTDYAMILPIVLYNLPIYTHCT